MLALLVSAAQAAAPGCVVVRARDVAGRYEAYGVVESTGVVAVRSALAGELGDFQLLPGDRVHAGDVLAQLRGPGVDALRARRAQDVRGAAARLATAREQLAIQKKQLASGLATQQAVAQATGAVELAQAALGVAQAEEQATRRTLDILAPVDGTVLTRSAAAGELVAAGQTVVTLQPAAALWLRADYYGAAASALQPGMTGTFQPADGSAPVSVKLSAIVPDVQPDGGTRVSLVARDTASWRRGTFGAVTLQGPTRALVVVPTRALILDQGKWWVLLHTAQGDARQAVVPGPAQGWETALEQGPAPGAEVVVENAYLEFHRDISEHYAPPD